MSIFSFLVLCVLIITLICPTEKGSVLSLILSYSCLPLKSVPLAICSLFLLSVGLFQGWYFALSLTALLLINLIVSITIGREVAFYA